MSAMKRLLEDDLDFVLELKEFLVSRLEKHDDAEYDVACSLMGLMYRYYGLVPDAHLQLEEFVRETYNRGLEG